MNACCAVWFLQQLATRMRTPLDFGGRFACNEKIRPDWALQSWVCEGLYPRDILSYHPRPHRTENLSGFFNFRVFGGESLYDPSLLIANSFTYTGPHVDSKPTLPTLAVLLFGVKLWIICPDIKTDTAAFIRGLDLKEMCSFLKVIAQLVRF